MYDTPAFSSSPAVPSHMHSPPPPILTSSLFPNPTLSQISSIRLIQSAQTLYTSSDDGSFRVSTLLQPPHTQSPPRQSSDTSYATPFTTPNSHVDHSTSPPPPLARLQSAVSSDSAPPNSSSPNGFVLENGLIGGTRRGRRRGREGEVKLKSKRHFSPSDIALSDHVIVGEGGEDVTGGSGRTGGGEMVVLSSWDNYLYVYSISRYGYTATTDLASQCKHSILPSCPFWCSLVPSAITMLKDHRPFYVLPLI